MKIRAHVIWLVAAALPVMIFSPMMTEVLWRQQRAAFEVTPVDPDRLAALIVTAR